LLFVFWVGLLVQGLECLQVAVLQGSKRSYRVLQGSIGFFRVF
jgi:metal-responsive CopG/Arc/MetJ family transcriptional regulator